MSLEDYHRSIGEEIHQHQNRFRSLLGEGWHRLSDGKHKENILKNVLRRHLPKSLSASNGFIRYADGPSSEIDIVIYNNTQPNLFSSDELVITTPGTISGAIEVKTSLNSRNYRRTLQTFMDLSERTSAAITNQAWNIQQQRFNPVNQVYPWFSLFSFESTINKQDLLQFLQEQTDGQVSRAIKCMVLNRDTFIRFWNNQEVRPGEHFTGWKCYNIPSLAFSYFISNVIWKDDSPSIDSDPWFPLDTKEVHLEIEMPLRLRT